jgi:hypothetical protein
MLGIVATPGTAQSFVKLLGSIMNRTKAFRQGVLAKQRSFRACEVVLEGADLRLK